MVTLAHFLIHWGLVENGVVEQYSLVHILLLVPVATLQLLTIVTVARLNSKLLSMPREGVPVEEMSTATA